MYAAVATGDLSPLFELCDADVEVIEPPEIPDASSYQGHEGISALFGKLREVFPDTQFAVDEFTANGDQVLVSMHWLGTGAGSGASARVPLFHVWSFENGLATRIRAFLDREHAVEAAGLRELSPGG